MNTKSKRKYLILGLALIGVLTLGWVLKSRFLSHPDKTLSFFTNGKRSVASSEEETIPLCKSPDNIVSSTLIGIWNEDIELTKRLANSTEGEVPLHEMTFTEDDEVTKLFGFLGKMGKCAYLAGHMTVIATKDGEKKTFSSPFILSESLGNPTIFFDEKPQQDTEHISDLHSLFVMVAKSTNSSKDILFVGGDGNNEDMRALRK